MTLLEFDLTEPLRSVLTSASDPDECSYAEERVGAVAAQPNLLVHMLESADTPLRAALVRSLGGIPPEKLPETQREPLIATVTRLFQSDPDPGIRSAAEWALRSWGRQELIVRLTKEMASAGPVDGRDWYVTPTGHTLVVFKGPITTQTGSPKEEPGRDASDEPISTRQINRDFALSTTEVTMEQFLAYFPQFPHKSKTDYVPTRDCAANMMTWHRACQYCLWLSQKEGIPEDQWCYTIVRKDAIPRDGYLSLTGYRLPTDVEWEYACRAGTWTPYSWGHDPVTSRRYAWTLANSSGRIWPVGRLCPNRFGLFDMHGNVSEWTSNFYLYAPGDIPKLQSGDDREDPQLAGQSSDEKADLPRVVRGGSAHQFVPYQRSANRTPVKARSGVGTHCGFRIARTIKSHATRRD